MIWTSSLRVCASTRRCAPRRLQKDRAHRRLHHCDMICTDWRVDSATARVVACLQTHARLHTRTLFTAQHTHPHPHTCATTGHTAATAAHALSQHTTPQPERIPPSQQQANDILRRHRAHAQLRTRDILCKWETHGTCGHDTCAHEARHTGTAHTRCGVRAGCDTALHQGHAPSPARLLIPEK